MQTQHYANTAIGTVGGTLLAAFASIQADDLLKTTVLAFTGALVSFTASLVLRWLSRKITRR